MLKYLFKALGLPVFWMSRLVPRSPRIWVFGAWQGTRLTDNSKYLYLYALKAQPGCQAIWITRSRLVRAEVRRLGGRAYLRFEPQALWYQLRAGVVVVCVSLDDVAPALTGGATIVNLWHGTPLKRIGADDDRFPHAGRGLLAPIWWLRNVLIRNEWRRYGLVPAASPEAQRRLMRAFELDARRVTVLGYPRNDLLVASPPFTPSRANVLNLCGVKATRDLRVIAYLPTHRHEGRERSTPFPFPDFDATALEAFLAQREAALLYKEHFYHAARSSGGAVSGSHVHNVTGHLADVQPLLAIADVLVTDVSSCYFDFLLCRRPIVFIASTLEAYTAGGIGFNEEYEAATPGIHVRSLQEF